MANEFVVRKGLISSGSINVSGSVFSTYFVGDGSQLTNISNSALPGGILSSSAQFNALTNTSASYALTASFALNSAGGGALSSSVVVDSYTFVGNDVTTNYQISKSYSDSSVTVTVGGLTYINPNDYSISGSTIVFVEPPLSASNISVKALMNVAQNATGSFSGSFTGDGSKLVNISAPLQVDTYTFDANGSTTIFNLGKTYSSDAVIVSVDGLTYTNPTDYSVAGTTVTFVDMPTSGSTISVKGFVNTGNATGSYSGSFVGDGSGLTTLPISVTKDVYQYTANGVTTNYTLSRLYDISSLNVSVAGLRYAPITDYTLNLFTLSFLTAPPSGANIYIDAFVNTPSVATGSFSGSFNGTFNGSIVTAISSSFALTASYASTASVANASTLTGATLASGVTASSLTSVGTTLSVNGVVVGRGGSAVATNTAVGTSALNANTTGQFNTATGYEALSANTTANNNTATGQAALRSNTTGGSNAAFGQGALYSNTTGNFNTAIGQGTLLFNTTGGNNTAIGKSALAANTTGSFNTAIGYNALTTNTTGISNTAVGNEALRVNTTGDYNTAIGHNALTNNTTGGNNTAIGKSALAANTTGNYSTATGEGALGANTTGQNNTANGQGTLNNNTTGGNNAAFGQGALYSNTAGAQNTAIGQGTLLFNTTGDYNTATGKSALAANTTGTNNTADGYQALTANTIGYQNVGVGGSALSGITTGYHNVAVGYLAGANLLGGVGSATTNTASVFLGHWARASASGNTNEIVIGAFAEGNGSNSATYGNTSMSKHVFAAGNVGIGTTSPSQRLDVSGSVNVRSASPTVFFDRNGSYTWRIANGDGTTYPLSSFNIANNAGTAAITVTTANNVGIGTSVPSASLHVSGTMMIQGVIERVNVTGSAPPSTLNVDAISGSVFYLSGSSANNWTINFRGSAATSLNSIMYPGQSMTFAVLVNHASVGYTASVHQIDGTSITPRWQGGTLPSGSGTSTDIYSYTLIKTANAAFNIFAAQTKFA